MKYTPRIEKALRVAGQYHDGHYRKEHLPVPYLTHLVSVASIVAEYSSDEEIICAALLHDTIEDTPMDAATLENLFTPRIRELVENVSEPKDLPSWRDRKNAYLTRLREGSTDALLIAVADKIHNIESKCRIAEEVGKEHLKDIGFLDEKYIWFYEEVYSIAKERLQEEKLLEHFHRAFTNEKNLLESI